MNIEKILGITPQMIERAKTAAARVEARALELPPIIDRQLPILLPKERLFDWTNRWTEGIKGETLQTGTDNDRWVNARAYLIPRMDSEKLALEFVLERHEYFLNCFVSGYSPKSRWPWTPEASEFDQWFEMRFVDWGPWDLGQGEICRVPDEISALMGEI